VFALYQLMEYLYETIELVQAGRYAESRAKLERRKWMHEEWARALPAGASATTCTDSTTTWSWP
jgi:hypothetical protein